MSNRFISKRASKRYKPGLGDTKGSIYPDVKPNVGKQFSAQKARASVTNLEIKGYHNKTTAASRLCRMSFDSAASSDTSHRAMFYSPNHWAKKHKRD